MNARAAQVSEVGAEPSQVLVGSVEVGGCPLWECVVDVLCGKGRGNK